MHADGQLKLKKEKIPEDSLVVQKDDFYINKDLSTTGKAEIQNKFFKT